MITKDDVGKQCFLRCKLAGSNQFTWENMGARIAGVARQHGADKIIIKMPAGERVAVESEDVRVLEPRPA